MYWDEKSANERKVLCVMFDYKVVFIPENNDGWVQQANALHQQLALFFFLFLLYIAEEWQDI